MPKNDLVSDEAFVTGVAQRIARRRMLHTAACTGAALLLVGVVLSISPYLITGADYVAAAPLYFNYHLVAALQSPVTEIGGLVFALLRVLRS